MSECRKFYPSSLQRFATVIRRSLLYILLLIVFATSAIAQSIDRAGDRFADLSLHLPLAVCGELGVKVSVDVLPAKIVMMMIE